MSPRIRNLFFMALVSLVALSGMARASDVTVFAAASLKEAMDSVAAHFEAASGVTVTVSYAASSTLARQIERGAPADVFVSASTEWMDHLETSGHIRRDTRVNLLGNSLVMIAPSPQSDPFVISAQTDLAALLDGGRLALALTDAVPAGVYARAALETLGLWDSVAAQTAETDNVRAAMTLVALGAAPLGIVYATDARAEPRVSVIAVFPPQAHPPIVYPAALGTRGGTPAAISFLDYLKSVQADEIFEAHGFDVLAE